MAKALIATRDIALDQADMVRKLAVLACAAALIFAGPALPL